MQDQIYFLNENLALLLIIAVSLLFAVIGILYSRKHRVYQTILPQVEMLEQYP